MAFEFFTLHIELAVAAVFAPGLLPWSAIRRRGKNGWRWEVLPLLASLSLFRLKKDGLAFFAAVYCRAGVRRFGVVLSAFGSTGPMIDAGMAVALELPVFSPADPVTGWHIPPSASPPLLCWVFLRVWAQAPSLPE